MGWMGSAGHNDVHVLQRGNTTNRVVRSQQIEQMDLKVCDDQREQFDALIQESWCVDDDKSIAQNVLAMNEQQANELYRDLRKLRYKMDDTDSPDR